MTNICNCNNVFYISQNFSNYFCYSLGIWDANSVVEILCVPIHSNNTSEPTLISNHLNVKNVVSLFPTGSTWTFTCRDTNPPYQKVWRKLPNVRCVWRFSQLRLNLTRTLVIIFYFSFHIGNPLLDKVLPYCILQVFLFYHPYTYM